MGIRSGLKAAAKESSRHLSPRRTAPGWAPPGWTVALAILLLWIPASLTAAPSYSEATSILKEEWEKRYPAELKSIKANPEGKGVYRTREKAGLTYYYHFRVAVPRLVRAEDLTLKEDGLRQIELWMRYRPATNSYDLAFVRRDLLPSGGTWIRL